MFHSKMVKKKFTESKECKYCGKEFYKEDFRHIFHRMITCGSKECKSKQRVDYSRENLKGYRKEYMKKYRKSEPFKQKRKIYQQKWIEKNPIIYKKIIKKQNDKQHKKERILENIRRNKLNLPLLNQGYTREKELLYLITNIFNKYRIIYRDRSSLKLKNEISKSGLELDIYIPELKLAFEHLGIHHYKFTHFLNHSIEEFNLQKYRDRVKKRICKEKRINLIRIKYNEKLSEQLILSKLKYLDLPMEQNVINNA